MTIYLGLGSNQGNRIENLEQSIQLLAASGFTISRISPVVESPALLPKEAEPAWNKPYLNCVIEVESNLEPKEGLVVAKNIEKKLGRVESASLVTQADRYRFAYLARSNN